MHTRPVITSATSRVTVCGATSAAGISVPTPPATPCAAPVMMVLSLKPTPVSVTTPITMPTVAAAAPTASAYLAPVAKASTRAGVPMRPSTLKALMSSGAATSATPKMASLTATLSMPPNTSTSNIACSPASSAQLIAVLPRVRVMMPTMAQELMPVKAAR